MAADTLDARRSPRVANAPPGLALGAARGRENVQQTLFTRALAPRPLPASRMPSPPPKRRRGPFHPLTMRPNAVHGLLGNGAPIPQQTMPAGPRNIMHDIGLLPIASPSVDPADAIRQAPPPPLVGQQPDAHPFQPFDSITPSHVLGLGTTSFYSVKYIPQAQQELLAIAVVDCIEQIENSRTTLALGPSAVHHAVGHALDLQMEPQP